jgi:hypothetical protein
MSFEWIINIFVLYNERSGRLCQHLILMKLFHCKFIIKLSNEVAGWQDGTYYVAVSTGPDNSIISISLSLGARRVNSCSGGGGGREKI